MLKIIILYLSVNFVLFGASDPRAIDVVHAFCSAEYDGKYIDDRLEYVDISPTRRRSMEKANPGDPVRMDAVDFRVEPLDIVSCYRVISVSVGRKKGLAEIEYLLLGSVRVDSNAGDGEAFIVGKGGNQPMHVTLKLEMNKKDGKWYVMDPPLPKVSKDALLKILSKESQRLEKTIDENRGSAISHIELRLKKLKEKIATIGALR